jgi:Phosphatase
MRVDRAPTRAELVAQLVAARIAGVVATPRANSVRHMQLLAQGDPDKLLGLDLGDRWPLDRVLALMARRSGAPAEPEQPGGGDYIDPERTVAALDRMAARLRRAAADRARVLLATGHPGGLLGTHLAIATALAAAGAELVSVPAGITTGEGDVRQAGGVAMLQAGGGLRHTHSPEPMRLVLTALAAAGRPLPELVVADHGWAGAAGQHGIDTVGFADCNDPALFVAEAEGTVEVTVPLEDNVPFDRYEPMNAYLLAAAGLSVPTLEPC